MINLNTIDVGEWIERTGWKTYDSDMAQLLIIYHDWVMTSPRRGANGALDASILINKTMKRMRHIHPNPEDYLAITALLILQMAQLARAEGLLAPELTKILH